MLRFLFSGLKRARRASRESRRALSRGHRSLDASGRRALSRLGVARLRPLLATGWFNARYAPPGEMLACPACGGRALKHLDPLWHFRRDASRYVGFATGCRRCGLVFANPQPTRAELAAYYAPESEHMDRIREKVDAQGRPVIDGYREARQGSERGSDRMRMLFASVRPQLDVVNPPPGAKMLDFGCGPGVLLDRFRALGWETYGLEPALKTAFPRHRELESPPAEPMFSLITVHHVLEHVPNPLEVLRSLSRALLDDGVLYISVPSLDGLPEHGDLRYAINARGHIVSYTADCLSVLLTMAGLTPLPVANDRELTDLLTGGVPRRLRLFARKLPAAGAVPVSPIAAAERAFRDYYRRRRRLATLRALVPVRLQASWLERRHETELASRRARKPAPRPA